MEVCTRIIKLDSRADEVIITFISDVHNGGADCDKNLLRRSIKKIKDDNRIHLWTGVGDYSEYIRLGDPRFDPAELERETRASVLNKLISRQTDQIVAEFDPIKDRCLGLIQGNHEWSVEQKAGHSVYDDLCMGLRNKAQWDLRLGYCCIMKLKFERAGKVRPLKISLHHGRGASRLPGASINSSLDLAKYFPFCDMYIKGHDHRRWVYIMAAIDARERTDKLRHFHRVFGDCGSYKRTYTLGQTSYGERAAHDPTSLGCISFKIRLDSTTDDFAIDPHCGTDGLPL